MVTKNAGKYVLIYVVSAAFLIIGGLIWGTAYKSRDVRQSEVIINVFELSGAEAKSVEINGWARLSNPPRTVEEGVSCLKNRADGVLVKGDKIPIEKSITDETIGLRCRGQAKNGCQVLMVLRINKSGNPEKREGQLIITLTDSIDQSSVNINKRLEEMETAARRLTKGLEFTKFVNIKGFYKGEMSTEQLNAKTKQILEVIDAENINTIKVGELVSVTALTRVIPTQLTLEKNSVNINMAFRYNSHSDTTHVYVGSPIITVEY